MSAKRDFLADARGIGVRQDLAEVVYDSLTRAFRAMPLSLGANLYEAFGIVDDELDAVVMDVANKVRLKLSGPEETAKMPAIQTVKDLLLFLETLPIAI